jgi:L-methionine (R)-S-oxide reductase
MAADSTPATAAHQPVWFDANNPIASAVRYLAGSSDRFDWTGVYVLNGDALELAEYVGAPTEHTRIAVGVGVCGTAVAENRDMNVPDVNALDNYLACSVETQSELVVLIRDSEGRILGQIDIDSHQRGAFTEADEQRVRRVAAELGARWPAARR